MFRQSLMALAIASFTAGSAFAAVSADEAKQLGTTLTPRTRLRGSQCRGGPSRAVSVEGIDGHAPSGRANCRRKPDSSQTISDVVIPPSTTVKTSISATAGRASRGRVACVLGAAVRAGHQHTTNL